MSDRALLKGKTVLITGAASGLGAACAEAASREGARVLLSDLNEEGLERVAKELPGEASCAACDVTDVEAARALVDRCVSQFGRIDGLANAAGIFDTRPFLEIEPEHFDRIFGVHVRAAFFLTQAAARQMVRQESGSIVNFSSTAGRYPRPMAAHYAAAKAAVLLLTRSAAVALAPSNVRVNAVCPGLIETPMINRIRHERSGLLGVSADAIQERWEELVPMHRLGEASEVADVVTFLLSDHASYVTGEGIGITGGTDAS
jgi:NAD(P)-dependent dehydrogenase (short-subunit alcohol dehydrogenase family)